MSNLNSYNYDAKNNSFFLPEFKEININTSQNMQAINKKNTTDLSYSAELENWKYWLAAKLVEKWQHLPTQTLSIEKIGNEMGLSRFNEVMISALNKSAKATSLSSEISSRIKIVRSSLTTFSKFTKPNLRKCLEDEFENLCDWFSQTSFTLSDCNSDLGCVAKLRSNAEELRDRGRLHLQNWFFNLQYAGSYPILSLLESVNLFLEDMFNYYESERQQTIKKENSARQSCYNLFTSLEKIDRFKINLHDLYKCIEKYFEFKLEAEVYNQVCRVIGETKEQIKFYVESTLHLNEYLSILQSHFQERCSEKPFFSSLLEKYLDEQMNSIELLYQVEQSVGYSFSDWGNFNLEQSKLLKEKILDISQQSCLKLYKMCCQMLIDFNGVT